MHVHAALQVHTWPICMSSSGLNTDTHCVNDPVLVTFTSCRLAAVVVVVEGGIVKNKLVAQINCFRRRIFFNKDNFLDVFHADWFSFRTRKLGLFPPVRLLRRDNSNFILLLI